MDIMDIMQFLYSIPFVLEKDWIDIILAIIQGLTLIFLIIYVKKTWDMAVSTEKAAKASENTLLEMKESRDQEIAPYVVTYFEFKNSKINLVIENVGKGLAKDVKIDFNPDLVNSIREADINNIPLIKEGIASMPPKYKIKTFFDTVHGYYGGDRFPCKYNATITYYGGINETKRITEYTLDIGSYYNVIYTPKKDLNDLVEGIENLNKNNNKIGGNLEKINNRLNNGIWIMNQDILIDNFELENDSWNNNTIALLFQFKILWNYVYAGNIDKLVNPFLTDLQNQMGLLSSKIVLISSKHPNNISNDLIDILIKISVQLLDLSKFEFYGDGGLSIMNFNNSGDEIIKLIDNMIEKMETLNIESKTESLKSKI